MTTKILNETIHEDGGYQATISSFGMEFAIHFIAGEVRAYRTNKSQYSRTTWKDGASSKKAQALAAERIAQLGPEFMAKHRALYEMA